MQTERSQVTVPRAFMYVPEGHQNLYVDCPRCDLTVLLGAATTSTPYEVWCRGCARPYIVEPPREE